MFGTLVKTGPVTGALIGNQPRRHVLICRPLAISRTLRTQPTMDSKKGEMLHRHSRPADGPEEVRRKASPSPESLRSAGRQATGRR